MGFASILAICLPSREVSAKINSALLRLTKDALLSGGIELPDLAREVVFPKGGPIVHPDDNIARIASPAAGNEGIADDGRSPSTVGEGNSYNETREVREQSERKAPEAEENLLKR